jgi:dUTP pyrophosphatase
LAFLTFLIEEYGMLLLRDEIPCLVITLLPSEKSRIKFLKSTPYSWTKIRVGDPTSQKEAFLLKGVQCLDLLGSIYENDFLAINHQLKDAYFNLIKPNNIVEHRFKVKLLDPKAIVPTKARPTDSGFDVSAISLTPTSIPNVYHADLGLAVQPCSGWGFDLVGRSSLTDKGWQFLTGVGIIDRAYTGSMGLKLLKLDDRDLPPTPFKCGQLVPRPLVHFGIDVVTDLDETSRGDGGFGSTDAPKK